MDHGLELIIARLKILEIGVCNIIYNPGNIVKRIFSLSPTPPATPNSETHFPTASKKLGVRRFRFRMLVIRS